MAKPISNKMKKQKRKAKKDTTMTAKTMKIIQVKKKKIKRLCRNQEDSYSLAVEEAVSDDSLNQLTYVSFKTNSEQNN